jgi:hypothetical protein
VSTKERILVLRHILHERGINSQQHQQVIAVRTCVAVQLPRAAHHSVVLAAAVLAAHVSLALCMRDVQHKAHSILVDQHQQCISTIVVRQ